jgi:hypothetical protein
MAKLPLFAFALLVLATAMASPAFAGKGPTRKEKDAQIKALEEQIHQLRGQEKAALKGIDERYGHIIRNMNPKEIHHQLEEILVVLRQVKADLGHGDELSYGGNRIRANESIEKADHQVERALRHDTPEERAKAAHDIGAVHEDLGKALVFSAEHPLDGKGKAKDELERRAAENQRLIAALPTIGLAHHLLVAVDHEIKDYKEERNEVVKRRDHEKNETKEQFGRQVKALQEQIKSLKK